ncbi:MAG: M56 family metallopeptidase, partial [Hyphomonas sp.]
VFSWLKTAAPAPAPVSTAWEPGLTASPPPAPLPAAPETLWSPEAAMLAAPEAGGGLMSLLLLTGIAVWLAGAIWMAARSLHSQAEFMAVVKREGEAVRGPLAELAAAVAAETGLKRMPRVVTSLIASGPFVTGLLRPTIVLPAWFEADYSETEARAALAHELMHVKRGDLWALQAAEMFTAVMWLNPLVYPARRAFRTDQEAACDADVLARGHLSPHAYGATLIKAVRMQTPARLHLAASLPLTHALKERLKLMAYPAPDSRRRWTGMAAAALIGAGALAGTASIAAAGEAESKVDIKIHNGSAWLDGEPVENRRIVLLTDPAEGLVPVPPMPPEVAKLTAQISAEVAELMGPKMLGPVIRMSTEINGEEFAALGRELAGAHIDLAAISARGEADGRRHELEARTERIQAEIEARAARLEAHIERETEARTRGIEHRIEQRAAELEAVIERHVERSVGQSAAQRSRVIADLVTDCRDTAVPAGEARVLRRETASGNSVKIACLEGAPNGLDPATLEAIAASAPDLTEAERQRLVDAGTGRGRTVVYRSSHRGEAGPATPRPPHTPQPL